MPSNLTVLKVKWVQGICEPTLLYLMQDNYSSDSEKASYYIDVARIIVKSDRNVEFELRMRQTFQDQKVTDFDSVNISRKQLIYATIEDG